MLPNFFFATPKKLPNPNSIPGRVVVLDIAFSAFGLKPSFETMTGPFIEKLGDRLACWIDHHDHPYHENYKNDSRFILSTKKEHPACPEMITPEVVDQVGPIDSIVCHLDFDGLFSAAKWILNGVEPYKGADMDAAKVDSRLGIIVNPALSIDHALRANFRDEHLKYAIINFLIQGKSKSKLFWEIIKENAKKYELLAKNTEILKSGYSVDSNIAYLKVGGNEKFDITQLLLEGQKIAKVSIIEFSGNLAIAAPFDSGINFISLFDLGGGMPTRVTISRKRKKEIFEKLKTYLN
jgi:hypothetical protein